MAELSIVSSPSSFIAKTPLGSPPLIVQYVDPELSPVWATVITAALSFIDSDMVADWPDGISRLMSAIVTVIVKSAVLDAASVARTVTEHVLETGEPHLGSSKSGALMNSKAPALMRKRLLSLVTMV